MKKSFYGTVAVHHNSNELEKPMIEIVALLQTIAPLYEKMALRQLSQFVYGMLVASGRITMLGKPRASGCIFRPVGMGGEYRLVGGL